MAGRGTQGEKEDAREKVGYYRSLSTADVRGRRRRERKKRGERATTREGGRYGGRYEDSEMEGKEGKYSRIVPWNRHGGYGWRAEDLPVVNQMFFFLEKACHACFLQLVAGIISLRVLQASVAR